MRRERLRGRRLIKPLVINGQWSTVTEQQLKDHRDLHLPQEDKLLTIKTTTLPGLTFSSLRVDNVDSGIQGTSPDLILSNCQKATLQQDIIATSHTPCARGVGSGGHGGRGGGGHCALRLLFLPG